MACGAPGALEERMRKALDKRRQRRQTLVLQDAPPRHAEQTPAKTVDGLPAAAQGETEKRRRTGAEEKQRIVRRIGAQIKAEKRPQQCDGPLQEAGRAPEDEMKGIKNSPGSAFRGRSFKVQKAFIKIFQNVRPSALFASGKPILQRRMALLRLPAWHGRNIPGRRGIRF